MERKDIYISFEIGKILKKVVQEEPLTVDENAVLNSWLKKNSKNVDYYRTLSDNIYITDSIKQLYKTKSELQFHLVEEKLKQKKIKRIIRGLSIASGIIIVLNIGLLLYVRKLKSEEPEIASQVRSNEVPASKNATLTLSMGNAINLKNNDEIKIAGGVVTYGRDGSKVAGTENITSAVLKTPRGGQYQITLSDGTKVWLNANSSLEYPMKFTDRREVILKGEAYFDVHHDPEHPFIVKTDIQQVKVLGTIFNIRAYDKLQYTTLLKGSVEVKLNGSTSTKKIKPNEQAVVNDYGLSIQKVDASDFIAWKEGLISSGSITLLELSKDIELWWDIKFKFPQNFTNTDRAYLTINKNEKLATVLKVIEKTYGVKTEIHGKEVIIR